MRTILEIYGTRQHLLAILGSHSARILGQILGQCACAYVCTCMYMFALCIFACLPATWGPCIPTHYAYAYAACVHNLYNLSSCHWCNA